MNRTRLQSAWSIHFSWQERQTGIPRPFRFLFKHAAMDQAWLCGASIVRRRRGDIKAETAAAGACTLGPVVFVALLFMACLAGLRCACASAPAAESKRVVLLHSFGRDFKPWSEYARSVRAEL